MKIIIASDNWILYCTKNKIQPTQLNDVYQNTALNLQEKDLLNLYSTKKQKTILNMIFLN